MATVSNTIKLSDQMSPVFKQILQSMNQTLRVMEQLDTSAQKADFSKQFGLARNSINDATQAIEQFEQGMQEADNQTKKLKDRQKGVSDGFKDWQKNLIAVNAAISLVQKGVGLIKSGAGWVNDTMEAYNTQATAEIQLAVVMSNNSVVEDAVRDLERSLQMTADAQVNVELSAPSANAVEAQYNRILEKAGEIQSYTMYGDEAMIAGAGELATYLQDAKALESAMDTLSMYAAGMSAGGVVDDQAMINYATQLGMAFDGQMSGMSRRGFSLTDEQKEFMKTASDMERVALITDMIAESWEGLDRAVANTPLGVTTQFLNDFGDIRELAGQEMAPGYVQLMQVLRENLPIIQEMFLGLAQAASAGMGFISDTIITAVISGFEWLKQNIETVKMVLLILGAIATAVGLGMAISWLISVWPLLLIIGIVIMIVKVLEQMGVTTDEVIDFISGLFGGLYAFIYNIVAEIYNLFVTFAEFFANFLNDPIGSIMRLFSGLADFVLGILQTIASAIDAIFGSSLADAVSGWRSGLADAVEAQFGPAEIQLERMEQMEVIDGVKKGQEVAKDLTSALENLPDLMDPTSGLFAGAGGATLDSVGDIGHVGSVGSIDDPVSFTDEDIRLMKDMASREWQLHYTQLPPSLTANFGDIRETADAGAILEFVEDSVAEAMRSSLYVGVGG